MSRRVLCLLLALCLLCSGCGKQQSAPAAGSALGTEPALPSETPQPDSSLEGQSPVPPGNGTFAMPYNASYGWNPYACRGMENRAVMQLIYEGLFTMNPDFEAEFCLCEEFSVSEDGLLYELTLRDATFSNGKKLQALDVIHSMGLAEASELYSGRFADIASYYINGEHIIVELSTANDRLPCLLTFPIVPSGSSTEAPPGTGPFVRGSDSVLTPNGQWWKGTGTLSFQTVALYSSASAEDTRDNFEIDNVHFVYNNPSASSAATFHCDYELWNSPGTTMQYIGFNFIEGIFQDTSVRKALTHAIDRSSIVEQAYHNFADSAVLPVAPATSMYFEELVQDYNFTSSQSAMKELTDTASFWLPEERIAALKNPEAEVSPSPEVTEAPEDEEEPLGEEEPLEEEPEFPTDGENGDGEDEDGKEKEPGYNRIVFIVRAGNLARVTAAQQVAEDLARVGFTVDLQELEDDEYYTALNAGAFDIYYGETVMKPDFDLRELLLPEGNLSYGGIGEESKLRSLLYNAMENVGNRYDLYKYIMEQGLLCPVLFVNNAVFTTRGVFTDLSPAPDNLFYQIENIKVN